MLEIECLEARNLPDSFGDLALVAGLGGASLAELLGETPAQLTGLPPGGLLGYSSVELNEALTMLVAPAPLPFTVLPKDGLTGLTLPLGTYSFNPQDASWHLAGVAPFAYGGPGWTPVVGDWHGDGLETIGVVDPSTEVWYLKNDNHQGEPSVKPFAFGAPGWRPVTGDWDHMGYDKVGVIDPEGMYHLAVPGGVRVALHG